MPLSFTQQFILLSYKNITSTILYLSYGYIKVYSFIEIHKNLKATRTFAWFASILIQLAIIINLLTSSFYVDVLSMLSLHGLYLDRLKLKALDSEGKLHMARQWDHFMNELSILLY